MNIRRVHIAGFGKIGNKTWEFTPGLNILYGPNESGKTSLMEAIKVLFYGFYKPGMKRVVLEPEYEKYRPWSGSGYGGFIEYELNGEIFRIQRTLDRQPLAVSIVSLDRKCDLTSTFANFRGEPQIGSEHLGLNKYMFVNTCWVGQGILAPDKEFGVNLKDSLTSGLLQSEDVGFMAARQALRKLMQEVGTDGASTKPVAFWRERLERLRGERQVVVASQDQLSQAMSKLRLLEQELEKLREMRNAKNAEYHSLKQQHLGYRWQEILRLQIELEAWQRNTPAELDSYQRAIQLEEKFEETERSWKASLARQEQAESQLARIAEQGKQARSGQEAAHELQALLSSWSELQWEFSQLDETGTMLSRQELKLALMTEKEISHLLRLEERIDGIRLAKQPKSGLSALKKLGLLASGLLVFGLLGAGFVLYSEEFSQLVLARIGLLKYLGGGIVLAMAIGLGVYRLKRKSTANSDPERRALILQDELEAALEDLEVRYPSELIAKWQQARFRHEQEQAGAEAQAEKTRRLVERRSRLEEQLRAKFVQQQAGNSPSGEQAFRLWLQELQAGKLRGDVALERIEQEKQAWVREWEKSKAEADLCQREISVVWQQAGAVNGEEFRHKIYRGRELAEESARAAQAQEKMSRLLAGSTPENIRREWLEAGQPAGEREVSESGMLSVAEELEKSGRALAECQAELERLRGEYRNELKHLGQLERLDEEIGTAERELQTLLRQRRALELADEALVRVEERIRARSFPQWTATVGKNLEHFSGGRYHELHWTEDLLPQLVIPENKQIVNLDQLSAGTKDMIYLALRFSLADFLGVGLPIFLDDSFVELDDQRWENIAQMLLRTGGQRQVFLFTCHERERGFFQKAGFPVQVFG